MSNRLFLALVGPCGAGKSTLATALSRTPDVDLVQEKPPKELGTEHQYGDLDMEMIQLSFLQSRLDQIASLNASLVVFDRTVAEDVEVFLKLHRELGGLSDSQLSKLERAAMRCSQSIGDLDATVVLSADPDVLEQRIVGGLRPQWLRDSFGRQLELYSRFFSRLTGPILDVNTTHLSAEDLSSIAIWITETIRPASKGRGQGCSRYGLAWRFVSPEEIDCPYSTKP